MSQRQLVILSGVRLVREGLARGLADALPGSAVLKECADFDGASQAMAAVPGAVLLVDASSAGVGSEPLSAHVPRLRGIVFGVRSDYATEVGRWAARGIVGFLDIDADMEELRFAIDRVAAGEWYRSRSLEAAVDGARPHVTEADGGSTRWQPLTAREVDVARLLQQGLSNKEIGRRLEIRPATVKNHVHHILEKLGVGRRGEAVALLQKRGGLSTSDE